MIVNEVQGKPEKSIFMGQVHFHKKPTQGSHFN